MNILRLSLLFLSSLLLLNCSHKTLKSTDWVVKHSSKKLGPGPNYFSSANVHFQEDGSIQLNITEENDKWYCAEMFFKKPLGYGTYTFTIDSPLNRLDEQVVLGMFLYHLDAAKNLEEIDIELLRHVDKNKQAAFTIHNKDSKQDHNFQHTFEVLTPNSTIFSIDWRETQVIFLAKTITGQVISKKTYPDPQHIPPPVHSSQNIPPPDSMIVHLNLYLFQGKAPISGTTTNVKVKNISFSK